MPFLSMGNKSGKEREELRKREEEEQARHQQKSQESPTPVLSDEEQFDIGEKFIKQAGCWEPYMKAVICINKTGDWSKCPEEAKALNVCLASSYIQKQASFQDTQKS